MKTIRSFAEIPPYAKFIGASWGDGSIDESIKDLVDMALDPAQVKKGKTVFFFELAKEIAK